MWLKPCARRTAKPLSPFFPTGGLFGRPPARLASTMPAHGRCRPCYFGLMPVPCRVIVWIGARQRAALVFDSESPQTLADPRGHAVRGAVISLPRQGPKVRRMGGSVRPPVPAPPRRLTRPG
jgi:hypothetical protein